MNCWAIGPGLYAKINIPFLRELPNIPGISFGGNDYGHCGEKEWNLYYKHDYGGDIIIGTSSRGGWRIGAALGGYWDIDGGCNFIVIEQNKIGCCEERI